MLKVNGHFEFAPFSTIIHHSKGYALCRPSSKTGRNVAIKATAPAIEVSVRWSLESDLAQTGFVDEL
jgi:ligand-binding sensor protein